MIEYVVMDYDGEPVTIEDGQMWEAEPPRSVWHDSSQKYIDKEDGEIYWDGDEVEWKVEHYDFNGNDRELYGMGWYDCNTDWRDW